MLETKIKEAHTLVSPEKIQSERVLRRFLTHLQWCPKFFKLVNFWKVLCRALVAMYIE